MARSQIVSAQPSMVSVQLVVWIPFEFLSGVPTEITLRSTQNAGAHSAKQ